MARPRSAATSRSTPTARPPCQHPTFCPAPRRTPSPPSTWATTISSRARRPCSWRWSTRPSTTTSLTASANPSAYGTPLTFTATVTDAPAAAIPTGAVIFWDGATTIGSSSIRPGTKSGTATLTIASLGAGVHDIRATYSGGLDYKGSESAVEVRTINPVATTTTLASALNPSKFGQSAMLTATVHASGGTIQPTGGTVQFWSGSTLLGTAALANSNQASLPVCTLAAGSHAVRAVFLASANFQASTSGSVTQQVVKNQTVVQLGYAMTGPTATPASSSAAIDAAAKIQRQVVFTVQVYPAGAPAYLTNEGTVTIYQSNGRSVATLPVQNGRVTLTEKLTKVDHKTYYAVYNGTADLGKVRSNKVRVT